MFIPIDSNEPPPTIVFSPPDPRYENLRWAPIKPAEEIEIEVNRFGAVYVRPDWRPAPPRPAALRPEEV